ncbi:hypothetical protein OUZ56_012233 [Daphnia magna]|uniref:Secreted protein n=1 Tax=Daphnia magna TaxID=35525 RepID=A0ABQ9Z2E9_9CRUS|nr:hypothetical protein OUZ56_012233 [Daphnia magna]
MRIAGFLCRLLLFIVLSTKTILRFQVFEIGQHKMVFVLQKFVMAMFLPKHLYMATPFTQTVSNIRNAFSEIGFREKRSTQSLKCPQINYLRSHQNGNHTTTISK